MLLRDTVHQISPGESAAARLTTGREVSGWGWPVVSPAVADSPGEIWWTVSRNYTVLFLSCDVQNTKFNQYLPVDLMSLNLSNWGLRKPVMFWRWRHHGVALWCHGLDAGHNYLLLTTGSNFNCWADVTNHVTRLWQVGDMENSESWITG